MTVSLGLDFGIGGLVAGRKWAPAFAGVGKKERRGWGKGSGKGSGNTAQRRPAVGPCFRRGDEEGERCGWDGLWVEGERTTRVAPTKNMLREGESPPSQSSPIEGEEVRTWDGRGWAPCFRGGGEEGAAREGRGWRGRTLTPTLSQFTPFPHRGRRVKSGSKKLGGGIICGVMGS